MPDTVQTTSEDTVEEESLDSMLAELDKLIAQATTSEHEGANALAIRSLAW